jgi:hypothetical protein
MLKRNIASLSLAAVSWAVLAIGASATRAAEPGNPLIGGWRAEHYYLKDGSDYPLLGQILFTEKNFQVIYIVVQDGKPQRGSGEGGDYTVEANNVTFIHHYIAAPEAPAIKGLKAQTKEAKKWEQDLVEHSTFDVKGDELTLFMPSGNRLTWTRISH